MHSLKLFSHIDSLQNGIRNNDRYAPFKIHNFHTVVIAITQPSHVLRSIMWLSSSISAKFDNWMTLRQTGSLAMVINSCSNPLLWYQLQSSLCWQRGRGSMILWSFEVHSTGRLWWRRRSTGDPRFGTWLRLLVWTRLTQASQEPCRYKCLYPSTPRGLWLGWYQWWWHTYSSWIRLESQKFESIQSGSDVVPFQRPVSSRLSSRTVSCWWSSLFRCYPNCPRWKWYRHRSICILHWNHIQ